MLFQPQQPPIKIPSPTTHPTEWEGTVALNGDPKVGTIHIVHQRDWTATDEAHPERFAVIVHQQTDQYVFLTDLAPSMVFGTRRSGNGAGAEFTQMASRMEFGSGRLPDPLNPLQQKALFYVGAAFLYSSLNPGHPFCQTDLAADNSVYYRAKAHLQGGLNRNVAIVVGSSTGVNVAELAGAWKGETPPLVLSHLNPKNLDTPRENVDRLLALRSLLVREGENALPRLENVLTGTNGVARANNPLFDGESRAFLLAIDTTADGVSRNPYPLNQSARNKLKFLMAAVDSKIREITVSPNCSPVLPGALQAATQETFANMMAKVRFPAATISVGDAAELLTTHVRGVTYAWSTARQAINLRLHADQLGRAGPFTGLVSRSEAGSPKEGNAPAFELGVELYPGEQLRIIRGAKRITAEIVTQLHLSPEIKLAALDKLAFAGAETMTPESIAQVLLRWGGDSPQFVDRVRHLRLNKAGPFAGPPKKLALPIIRAKLGVDEVSE